MAFVRQHSAGRPVTLLAHSWCTIVDLMHLESARTELYRRVNAFLLQAAR